MLWWPSWISDIQKKTLYEDYLRDFHITIPPQLWP